MRQNFIYVTKENSHVIVIMSLINFIFNTSGYFYVFSCIRRISPCSTIEKKKWGIYNVLEKFPGKENRFFKQKEKMMLQSKSQNWVNIRRIENADKFKR